MAEFNVCSTLTDDDECVERFRRQFSFNTKPLETMMKMQEQLQWSLKEKLSHLTVPAEVRTKGELIDCLDANFDAIMDEFRELKTSVGGMSRGDKAASAAWKRWKTDNTKIREELLSDMSTNDLLEMKFEFVDIFHFILNMCTALGITYEELFVLYMLKNKENARRYNSGY